ncbi:MAG: hypothetical protein BMS9Abin15_0307 [Gammaproteobacteria bacterium]|nr:MAG: hypothetical protein BMS9Abin15_0307 [Gammaproteobacteria bacterium]
MNVHQASNLLKALANEHRLMILCHLVSGEKSVRELEELVGLRQTTLSQHLARLRHEGMVSTRREAQNIYYALNSTEGSRILEALHGLYCEPGELPKEPQKISA